MFQYILQIQVNLRKCGRVYCLTLYKRLSPLFDSLQLLLFFCAKTPKIFLVVISNLVFLLMLFILSFIVFLFVICKSENTYKMKVLQSCFTSCCECLDFLCLSLLSINCLSFVGCVNWLFSSWSRIWGVFCMFFSLSAALSTMLPETQILKSWRMELHT